MADNNYKAEEIYSTQGSKNLLNLFQYIMWLNVWKLPKTNLLSYNDYVE